MNILYETDKELTSKRNSAYPGPEYHAQGNYYYDPMNPWVNPPYQPPYQYPYTYPTIVVGTGTQITESEGEKIEKSPLEDEIRAVCNELADFLVEKNRKYGNSASAPVRIFSKADAKEQIRVRIDDKLSRLISSQSDEDEDVVNDLLGYLILLKINTESDE